jgi:LacI family transcriptional regulator
VSATMRDVAQKANVSIKTVSRVVNDQGEISETTRKRVLAVIKELGYRPNKIARGLVTQRTYTVGLVVPDITNPFFPEVARGVQDVARAQDYNVFLCNSDESQQEELRTLHSLADQGVDGIIIFPCYQTQNNLDVFAAQYRPIIAINHICDHANVSLVLTDNYQGAKLAVDYLLSKGHREIGMLAGLETSPQRGRRVHGFLDALAAYDLSVVEPRILSGLPTLASGYEVALRLLKQDPPVTAIFSYNDLQALGAIQACKELGRHIPADCAIIGFDDIQLASLVDPALTTIRIDKYSMGQQAMRRLLDMLDNPDMDFSPIEMDVELVVRESA